MTERGTREQHRLQPPIALAAVAAFLVLVIVLAIQLRDGHDPALGSGFAGRQPVRQVLLRRIIRRKVIVRVIPAAGGVSGSAGAGSAPPIVSSAPAPSAPVAAPAPPPVTRTS